MTATKKKAKAKSPAKKPGKALAQKSAEVKKPALPGRVALSSLTLHNVLSFGAEAKVDLEPLNVLIGPNGCGKSNLMDVVALLKAAATGYLSDEFRGGAMDWPWKNGTEALPEMRVASEWRGAKIEELCRHEMAIQVHDGGSYSIVGETVGYSGHGHAAVRTERAEPRASILSGPEIPAKVKKIGDLKTLSGERMPSLARLPIGSISALMADFGIYRNRYVGRGRGPNPLRAAGRADGEKWRTPESLDDFPMVLNRVYPERGDVINEKMREFYGDARQLHFSVFDGAVQVKLEESGGRMIPAHRMSDGMLNWLFLLTVLLDPKPPALVCIEEPETGIHPELLPTLAEMLIDASSRMQLIITTHSDMIVDCLTDYPEAVVVCDKADGATQMKRLRAEDFHEWKEEGLGMTWIRGAIGGTRW